MFVSGVSVLYIYNRDIGIFKYRKYHHGDKFQKAVRRTECLCHKETKRHADDTAADRKNRRLQRIDQKDLIAAASAAFQKGDLILLQIKHLP